MHREQNYQINWNHADPAWRGAAGLNVGGTWYAASLGALQGNTWYHLAATYDGDVLRAYKDGVLISSNADPSGNPSPEVNSLKFGRHAAVAQFFAGTIDDVRIYSRALSAVEISALQPRICLPGQLKADLNDDCVVDWRDFANFAGSWLQEVLGPPVGTSMTLRPSSGPVGTNTTITGSGFSANTDGRVFFDSNRNGVYDSGEASQSQTTTPDGTLAATLSVPSVATGTYPVVADFPIGVPIESYANFTVTTTTTGPRIILDPDNGRAGRTVTITGTGFAANTSCNLTFEGISQNLKMTVPWLAPGTYPIKADCPIGDPIEASATFWVTTGPGITLHPASGPVGLHIWVSGSGFAGSAAYKFFWDTNGNGVFDPGEAWSSSSTGSDGTLLIGMTVPSVKPGSYPIQADCPIGGPIEASATFWVTTGPGISLEPWERGVPCRMWVDGVGFAASTPYRVFFDRNSDGDYDAGEPKFEGQTESDGDVRGDFDIPAGVPAGDYEIRCDCPIGGAIEASQTFTVLP